MPIIYLKHPIHGAKVATMELEAEADERNGWERYTLDQVHDDAPEVNALTTRTRRRREVADVHHSG